MMLSVGELAAKLVLDKSVISRRLGDASDRGYLVNLETRRGRPARIVLGPAREHLPPIPLVEPKAASPPSRPASGRAPRAAAVKDAGECHRHRPETNPERSDEEPEIAVERVSPRPTGRAPCRGSTPWRPPQRRPRSRR